MNEFFKDAEPNPKQCFTIQGPVTADGIKNFNIACDSETDCRKWVESIRAVFQDYKSKNKRGIN